ncbi:T9SS type A sorting domain-containing protein [Hanstruepera ponticola]|uniref:T9SS type A sorting domain-containing protein n=1 Tax=Hanstruepera ponticola TaxID=2042995 RepID=UPI000CF098F5|nr:T9SS type A sorting domain-containing protein [Hanstruepera ponticola]
MKQFLALTALLISISINAQIVNIPDANFKAALIAVGVDTNNDGEIQVSEAEEVTTLNIGGFGITNLAGIENFINLLILSCYNNEIQNLDLSENEFLERLSIDNNQLTSIDLSPLVNLQYLYCSNNQLTEIDLSNNLFLRSLQVDTNDLTELDVSGNFNLNYLQCNSNLMLTYLNIKNGVGSDLGIELTELPSLEFICVDEERVSFLTSLFDYAVVSSYCSFTPGGEFFTVSGNSILDLDTDGCDVNDNSYPQLKFHITDGNIEGHAFSDNTGDFNIYVQNGTHIITPVIEIPDYFTVSPSSLKVSFPEDGETVTQGFCITPNGSYNDLEIVLAPYSDAVPGFDSQYGLIFKNKGNTVLSGSISLNYDDDFMDFVSSNTSTSSQSTGLLNWDFTDLAPFETRTIQLTMNLNTPTDSEFPLNSDDVLTFEAEIVSGTADETPDDNIFQLNQIVVNSFDPNDKTCLEGNTLDVEKVGDYLHYMICFENMGTANATNIVVKDELDTDRFDVSSLIPLNASHDFVTKVSNGNLIEFIFENINLPFDDDNNDGFIVYKVKTLPDLEIWDVIENDAEIFFDFNFPIVTNNEQTTVVEEGLSISEFEVNTVVKIFPNPTSDILNINAKRQIRSLKLFDITGQEVGFIKSTVNNQTTTLNINKLSTGIYFLEVQTDSVKSIHKVIKK